MGVSAPPFRVPEKMKQGSEPHFMVTAIPNGEVPDIVSNYLLIGDKVPGNLPSKKQISKNCSRF